MIFHALDAKTILFLQVIVVIGIPLILWKPLQFGRFFPLPIIQIFVGIALGPSLFELVAPDMYKVLFGPGVKAGVGTLSNIAVVLFVFLAGCEADRQILRRTGAMVMRIGVIGVATPWILGGIAAWILVAHLPLQGIIGEQGNVPLYAIAFGLCMAVTALPVLVIVLRELGYNRKPIGTIALAIGGLDDGLLWLSLAIVLPFAAGTGQILLSFVMAAAGGLLAIAFVHFVVTPFLEKLIHLEAPERFLMSAVILVLFIAAVLTEYTGLHAVFGAFVTGLLLPDKLRHMAQDKFDVPVCLLLLPFFFLATGLNTELRPNDPTIWILILVALVVCIGGKFVGISLPTYLSGQSAGFSITLGALMQCKGLMEIVVVTILYQKKVFGVVTFSALIMTALLSTALTAPLARLSEWIFGSTATETREEEHVAVTVAEGAPAAAAVPARAGPVLVFDHDIGMIPIEKSEFVIGRHGADDIRVDDLRVSRHHARLKALDDGRYEIHNQTAVRSEPNPILINGEPKETAVLDDGDVVSLGGVNFTFRKAA